MSRSRRKERRGRKDRSAHCFGKKQDANSDLHAETTTQRTSRAGVTTVEERITSPTSAPGPNRKERRTRAVREARMEKEREKDHLLHRREKEKEEDEEKEARTRRKLRSRTQEEQEPLEPQGHRPSQLSSLTKFGLQWHRSNWISNRQAPNSRPQRRQAPTMRMSGNGEVVG